MRNANTRRLRRVSTLRQKSRKGATVTVTLKRLLIITLLITLAWIALSATPFYMHHLREPIEEVLFIRIRDELSGGTKNYVRNTVNVANYRGSRLIVISLDTSGGNVGSVEGIMSILDESKIPVVVFVEPFRAISGGTYVLMAAHIAVMKSGSQIGSCQPVSSTGKPITEQKYVNYLAGLMRSHAWLHSRNETAAELFVTENLNLHAEEAFRFKVIDLIAEDLQDTLSKLTNYVLVKYKDGETLRFILISKEEMDKYKVIQSWDFKNINEATVREFRSTVEFLPLPSFLFEYPIVLSLPIALLFPYVYPVLVVPMLSLTVSPSLEILVALFSGVNGAIGVGCVFLVLLKKRNAT